MTPSCPRGPAGMSGGSPPPIGRRVLKTAWRIAADPKLSAITDVDELMRQSRRLADLIQLNRVQHRRACGLVIEHGEDYLARWLTEMDTVGPFDLE